MGLVAQLVYIYALALILKGSSGYNISPSPATFSSVPTIEEGTPSAASQPNGSITGLVPSSSPGTPIVNAPSISPSGPQRKSPGKEGLVPSLSPSTPTVNVPSISPTAPPTKPPDKEPRVSVPPSPVPVASPSRIPPLIQPPNSHQGEAPGTEVHPSLLIAPVASPPSKSQQNPPAEIPGVPLVPPTLPAAPVASPPSKTSQNSLDTHPIVSGESPSTSSAPDASRARPPISSGENGDMPNAPPKETSHTSKAPDVSHLWIHPPSGSGGTPIAPPPRETSPTSKGSFPIIAPSQKSVMGPTYRSRSGARAPAPGLSFPLDKGFHSPVSLPSTSFSKHHHPRNNAPTPAPKQEGASIPPVPLYPPESHSMSRKRPHAPPPRVLGFLISPASSPSPTATSAGYTKIPLLTPEISPSTSSLRNPKITLPPPIRALPPPPPNEDCTSTTCTEPYTNTPPGSPCACVMPMQVGLSLNVALYTFFPLVSELAEEIASGVFMKQSQVRIMGANAASTQPEKTIVLIDLVPLGDKFDNTTALLTFQRFWNKKVAIKASYFGDYEVLYVRYPGLPESPPSAPSSVNMVDGGPYSGQGNNGRAIKPIGVDVSRGTRKDGLSSGVIVVIVMSVCVAVVLCFAAAWVLLLRHRDRVFQPTANKPALLSSLAGPSGSMMGSGRTSASLSFSSSMATYTARTFSSSEIEKATDKFDESRVLGEGGFGRVYSGVLEDGTKIAVKVLKRDDHQGGREFLAEVEMLSRLHHRNLVKLIGICTEDRSRCLVYELIPNGSVESHLHGTDGDSALLDWGARMKIALGSARGLAYLHEDSSPRVIHRDFKSSNILLEHDFTPKVSDFGLARTAMDEESQHISTRVMGTFGYVAPEYAMTGHLLVKSDVYSYGVVLLELLSGRKPIDMSQPPGQENLVAWARPLLTSPEGLEIMIDSSLGSDFPFDSAAKVAAIASMCVQPEVSHRPFMGEVVQALKLVCNECDDIKETTSQEDLSMDLDQRVSTSSSQFPNPSNTRDPVHGYDSGFDHERGLSVSELLNTSSARFGREASWSFRRHSSSGPLSSGSRGGQFWQRIRRLSGGSVSDHGVMFRFWPGSH